MVAIPFPLSSAPGELLQEGGGRLVNCFAEPLPKESGRLANWRRCPGLATWGTTAHEDFRGFGPLGSTLYAAFGGKVVKWSSAAGGASTAVGDLAGTGKVFFARNNKRPIPDLLCVSENGAFRIGVASVVDLNDADLPQPNGICFLDGYFFFSIGDGRCFASGLNDYTVNANHFITTEGKPDALMRPIPWNGRLLLFGTETIESWSNAALSEFPFSRETVIQRGLASSHAVAGHESGFGKALLFVGDDLRVNMLNGYTPEPVSPPDLDRLIEAVADKNTLEASVHMAGGHAFWTLSSPDWTWEFDLNTLKWHERESYLQTRWRGTQTVYAFGKWLCGDTESGNVLEVTRTAQRELDNPLPYVIETGVTTGFPSRIAISRIDVDVATGVGHSTGDDDELNPTIEVSVARDCVNFDNPRLVGLGPRGATRRRVFATRFGLSGEKGFRARLRCASPVDVVVMGADATAAARNK